MRFAACADAMLGIQGAGHQWAVLMKKQATVLEVILKFWQSWHCRKLTIAKHDVHCPIETYHVYPDIDLAKEILQKITPYFVTQKAEGKYMEICKYFTECKQG